MDWYGMLDRMSDEQLRQELDRLDKGQLKALCINLVRCWAFQEKQNEIRNEHFYREVVRILNE